MSCLSSIHKRLVAAAKYEDPLESFRLAMKEHIRQEWLNKNTVWEYVQTKAGQ